MKATFTGDDRVDSEPGGARAGSLADSFSNSLRLIWRFRLWVLVITACATGAGIVAVVFSPYRYEATVLVAPVTSDAAGRGLDGLVSQFGGLASLAGITMPSSTEKAEIVATLQSETLTRQYIAQNNLLPILFPARWDPAQRRWRGEPPTLWQASRLFRRRIRNVVEEKKTGLVRVAILWTDAQTAANWANGLVEMANEFLRKQAIEESERSIAYLNRQAARSDFMEVRTAIYAVLETQIKKAMLARESRQYALKVIDRAFAPEKPVSPRPVLWVLTALLLGLIISVVMVVGVHSLKSRA